MRIIVKCPHCGKEFILNLPAKSHDKGVGAHYAHEIKSLGRLHLEILRILAEAKHPMTKKAISYILHKKGIKVSGNSVSGRLSELLGMGLVRCYRTKVREYDERRKVFRFVKKPVWVITEEGRKRIGH